MEAVLLAGGLGTRLHQVTGDKYPKCLAQVNGKPFLHYLLDNLLSQGVNRFVLAVSHHAQMIVDEINTHYPTLDVVFSHEEEPLGTGGAIKQALQHCKDEFALVINADSFMESSLNTFTEFAKSNQSDLSIICTKVPDISRFGAADIDPQNKLNGFFEKGKTGEGYINSGVYWINTSHPALLNQPAKFSFEHKILSNPNVTVFAYKISGLFFDIGTPDDFAGSQELVRLNQSLFNHANQPNKDSLK